MNREEAIKILITCCKTKNQINILKCVRKKKNYRVVAKELKIDPEYCSTTLNKFKINGLVEGEHGFFRQVPIVRTLNIDSEIKKFSKSKNKTLQIKRKSQKFDLDSIKKELTTYIKNNFVVINHPFNNNSSITIKNSDLQIAAENLIKVLEYNLTDNRVRGLNLRFFQSFVSYFNTPRINRLELINSFSNLIKLFEPIMKKIASIKTNNNFWLNHSLDEEVIRNVCNFNSDIKKTKDSYWQSRPTMDASLRYIYPYRHIEAHDARDYFVYEMEKIVYFMFAAIIFVCLEIKLN